MEGFDRELFLSLCKKYNVPLSTKYKVPMIQEEDGTIKELTPEYLKQVLLQEDLRMASNNKKINSLREGIGRLTESLDNNWNWMKRNSNSGRSENTPIYASYQAMLRTIELLGGDWKRDENGRHRVFIAGVTAATDED